jgi:hypothetical protein
MMDIGMLWLDDDKRRSLEEKVQLAAAYYLNKYGQKPELCLVNKAMLAQEQRFGSIKVQPVQNIMPHYFWLGRRAS